MRGWLMMGAAMTLGIMADAASPQREAILDAARLPVTAELHKPVRFMVRELRHEGEWALLIATLQGLHGLPIDYAGTPLAGAAAEGMVSDQYAALLRHRDGHWQVVAHATGPTDVAWEGWARQYSAPAGLFAR